MTGQQAAEMLGVTLRHTRRILAKYRREGAGGPAHGKLGRALVNKLGESEEAEIARFAQGEYRDYNDSRPSKGGNGQHS